MKTLTETQIDALTKIDSIDCDGYQRGRAPLDTYRALEKRGLVEIHRLGNAPGQWRVRLTDSGRAVVTDAGRAALHGAMIFPIGARVLIDGQDEAIVKQVFPQGSTSYASPYYILDVVDGDRNIAVSMKRINVDSRIVIGRGKVIGRTR